MFGDPYFSFQTHFLFTIISTLSKNDQKNQCGKLKKNSRFLSTGHGILPSWGCKAREPMVAKCKLVLWGTSPVDKICLIIIFPHCAMGHIICLIGPLKPYLAEKFPFKALIEIFWGLQPLWPSSKQWSPIYSHLGVLPDMFSPKPPFFYISDITNRACK